jgi:hypothetical protein
MSNTPPPNPFQSPEDYEFFVFIVDGEVTLKFPVQTAVELMVAALSSDPKVIRLSSQEKLSVKEGWTYDGANFSEPVG